jgi:hypothetical protein
MNQENLNTQYVVETYHVLKSYCEHGFTQNTKPITQNSMADHKLLPYRCGMLVCRIGL